MRISLSWKRSGGPWNDVLCVIVAGAALAALSGLALLSGNPDGPIIPLEPDGWVLFAIVSTILLFARIAEGKPVIGLAKHSDVPD